MNASGSDRLAANSAPSSASDQRITGISNNTEARDRRLRSQRNPDSGEARPRLRVGLPLALPLLDQSDSGPGPPPPRILATASRGKRDSPTITRFSSVGVRPVINRSFCCSSSTSASTFKDVCAVELLVAVGPDLDRVAIERRDLPIADSATVCMGTSVERLCPKVLL
jgi:hypothetical protein